MNSKKKEGRDTSSVSPRVKARRALVSAIESGYKGEALTNIWLVHSSADGRSHILGSDASYHHFLSLEFALEVASFQLRQKPIEVTVAGKVHSVTFDAVVTLRSGIVECRNVAPEIPTRTPEDEEARKLAAQTLGGIPTDWSSKDLKPTQFRRQNTMRMLRCIKAAQMYDLTDHKNALLAQLASSGPLTLEALTLDAPLAEKALRHAALFILLQRCAIRLDIDTCLVTPESIVEVV